MVIPVGERYQQTMYLMTKQDGQLVQEALRPTLFVPMTGTAEASREKQPDPANPEVVNGSFEAPSERSDIVPGWYYGRQLELIRAEPSALSAAAADASTAPPAARDPTARDSSFVRFENQTPGHNAHLLQGLALDGRAVHHVRLEGRVRTRDVVSGPQVDQLPTLAISLYDEQRRELGVYWVGIFRGTRDWKSTARTFRIPPQTREAIVRIGLFGATGRADFDDIRLIPLP